VDQITVIDARPDPDVKGQHPSVITFHNQSGGGMLMIQPLARTIASRFAYEKGSGRLRRSIGPGQ
jgi:hypothetical protein